MKSPSIAEEQAGWQWTMVSYFFSAEVVHEGKWLKEPTSPGTQLEMIITERKEPLFAAGQCANVGDQKCRICTLSFGRCLLLLFLLLVGEVKRNFP